MWKDYIDGLKTEWIGKTVCFQGEQHKVVDVDYNGVLHIDRPTEHNATTAAFLPHEAQEALA